ncbi:lipase family protein [Pseudomonas granadensis]|uniref:lipase family protein n=1 Tax=Pseudomonas granadensis TaxID=1421430 RepID=UPI0019D24247|nr:lipase family protein [Pseudomonas granadensis]MBN6774356.1 lipase family protein [Pseudomonas granadensis]MBN6805170.1 lipase family protein [Pseudomonas granadensis]MBN6832382.1 lipase family protein [Pseudomonas granadensis]MBN6839364.1 lipase family protein [Pseudomonas granadensis]MBN6868805.1 lipase family protein [Pseudomonas granadensis]
MQTQEKRLLNDQTRSCPLKGGWVSFRLVDEFGEGKPYASLEYEITDCEGTKQSGSLDAEGYAKIEGSYSGPLILTLAKKYSGGIPWYEEISDRKTYPIPLTDLQVAAEQTLRRPIGSTSKTGAYRASAEKGDFHNIEVRDLVELSSHLPPAAKLSNPVPAGCAKLARDFAGDKVPSFGVGLLPEKHYVLEVRALRAFRPLLSLAPEFSALNLYQLSLLATLSYGAFGQTPEKADATPKKDFAFTYPSRGTIGHVLNTCLACFEEPSSYADSKKPSFPLVEDVPYSKRLEIVPFDPELYPQNDPSSGEELETPSDVHFFNDLRQGATDWKNTDTQAYVTHDDRIILIGVRGTAEGWDGWRDADAKQVPIEGGTGKAHQGFYEAFMALRPFIDRYILRFRTNQKIIVCGHSLGGAISLLLSEWLHREITSDVILYTFGSPRAGDKDFVESASGLVHHRIVNQNDPVPSVPAGWMDTKKPIWITGLAATVSGVLTPAAGGLVFAAGMTRFGGKPYWHHGEQRYFMPLRLPGQGISSVLWTPNCEGYEEAAMTRCVAQLRNNDTPDRKQFLVQAANGADHKMLDGYIPSCWASLRRWQDTLKTGGYIISTTESDRLKLEVETYRTQLKQWQSRADAEFPGGTIESRPQDRSTALQRRSTMSDLQDRQRAISQAVKHNEKELEALEETLRTITRLSTTKLTLAEIYGDCTALADLQTHIDRWAEHKENQESVRLAQIPSARNTSMA